jgi:hypothetical protein
MRLSILLALVLSAAVPAAAPAAPPWSAPSTVAEGDVFARGVLYSRGNGGAVLWQRGQGVTSDGSAVAELLAAPLGQDLRPGASRRVSTLDGALAAGRRFTFAGFRGLPRGTALVAGSAGRPGSSFAPRRVARVGRGGPTPVAAGGAVAYVVRPAGRPRREYVALSRLSGRRFGGARRISARGRIRGLALASNARGDTLAAWERGDRIEARIVTARGVRSPVRGLARVGTAQHLDAALATDGTAVVGWVQQSVSEGEALSTAVIRAAVRLPGRRFASARRLERYPDREIAGGAGVRVAIAGNRPVAAWTGRRAIRAAFADGTRFGTPQDLGPLPDRTYDRAGGLADLAAGPGGAALAVWLAPQDPTGLQLTAAALAPGTPAFGTREAITEPVTLVRSASAAFDPASGAPVVAWDELGPTANRVLVASRPAP